MKNSAKRLFLTSLLLGGGIGYCTQSATAAGAKKPEPVKPIEEVKEEKKSTIDDVVLNPQRDFTTVEMYELNKACARELVTDLWVQIYGRQPAPEGSNRSLSVVTPPPYLESTASIEAAEHSPKSADKTSKKVHGYIKIFTYGNDYSALYLLAPPIVEGKEPTVSKYRMGECRFDFACLDLRPQGAALKIPQLRWNSKKVDVKYDDLGREISSRTVATEIRLVNGTQPVEGAFFVNGETGAPAKLKLNFNDYSRCLREGVEVR